MFNNKYLIILKNTIHWHVYRYSKTKNMKIYFPFLLLTLNVPFQIGECMPRGKVPLFYTK